MKTINNFKIFTTERQPRRYCKCVDSSKTSFQTICLSMACGSFKNTHVIFFFFPRLKCLKSISIFTFRSAEEVNLWKQQSQFDQHKGQRIDKLEMLLKQAINIVNVSLTMSYNFSSQQEVSRLCQHKCQVPGPGDNCVQKNYSDSMQPFKSLLSESLTNVNMHNLKVARPD